MSPLDTAPPRRRRHSGADTPLTRAHAGGCPPVAEQAAVSCGEMNSPADLFLLKSLVTT